MNLNDITAAQMRAKLHRKYCNEMLAHELKVWQMLTARKATPLQRYCNSTMNRAMTARLLAMASYRHEQCPTYLGTTKQQCADELRVSLNSATVIVNHYLSEGWAVAHESSAKHIRASHILLDATDDYGAARYEVTTSDLWLNHQKLLDFDAMATSHLDFTDDFKSE